MVLFVTGLCSRSCYFCPISDEKYKKDVVYADEWNVKNIHHVIEEAKLIDAEGAGITGGDPLCKLGRTSSYIKKLKEEFGRKFHIHLYTSLDLVSEKSMAKLYDSGLDEIRIHMDMDDSRLWAKMGIVLEHDWNVGVEIPVIPGKEKEIKRLISAIDNINHNSRRKIRFLNLNELEIADNSFNKLAKLGYKTKNGLSYAIKGSGELALKIMGFVEDCKIGLDVHYCTAKLKDKVQLANRIKRRAENVKRPYDKVTDEGTLLRGVVYLNNLKPGFGYRKKLKNKRNKKKYLENLKMIKDGIQKDFGINKIELDKDKLRILLSAEDAYKIRDKIDKNFIENVCRDSKLLGCKELFLAVVEEYPTFDGLEVDVEFL
jgi:hypothetical protein